jgi:hypothetical protein
MEKPRNEEGWVEREWWGKGGEMAQTSYAHINK